MWYKTKISKYISFLLATCVFLSGCSVTTNEFKAERNGVYIKRDLGLKTAIISELSGEGYSKDGLEEFVKSEVTAFNTMFEKEGVSLDSATLENGTAKLIFSYDSPEALMNFIAYSQDNGVQISALEVMDLSSALSSGRLPASVQVKDDNKAVVVCIEGNAYLTTEGKILYAFSEAGEELNHTEYDINLDGGKNYIIFK